MGANLVKSPMAATGNESEIRTHDGAGLALSPPNLPAVAIHTMCEKKYTFFYLQRMFRSALLSASQPGAASIETVNGEVYINDRACACQDASKACYSVVIECTKEINLKGSRRRRKATRTQGFWNLSLPAISSTSVCDSQSCKVNQSSFTRVCICAE